MYIGRAGVVFIDKVRKLMFDKHYVFQKKLRFKETASKQFVTRPRRRLVVTRTTSYSRVQSLRYCISHFATLGMVAPPFTFRTIHNCVVVVTFHDTPTMECWAQYVQCFTRLYDKYAQFVIVFDVSGMGVPAFDVIANKKQLIMDLKPKTAKQVLATIVVTPYEHIRDIIVALVKAAGQSSPFYAFSETSSVVHTVCRLVRIIKRLHAPVHHDRSDVKLWGDLTFNARVAVLTLAILRALPTVMLEKRGATYPS